MTSTHYVGLSTGWIKAHGAIAALFLALGLVSGCASTSGSNSSSQLDAEEAANRGELQWRREEYADAMRLLRQAGKAGDARAQYAVGYMYYEGQGVKRDLEKALKWIRRAADQGDKRAIKALDRIANGLSAQPGRPDDADEGEGETSAGKERSADDGSSDERDR